MNSLKDTLIGSRINNSFSSAGKSLNLQKEGIYENSILLIVLVLSVLTTAAVCPSWVKENPIPPTPTPDNGLELYYGNGMQIMLPRSYVAEDIDRRPASIVAAIKNFVGGESSPLAGLVDSLEGNIGWYGYDSDKAAVYPPAWSSCAQDPAKLPISMVTMGIEKMLGSQSALVDSDDIRLGGRDVTRLTYSKDDVAWAAYLFKEGDHLWMALYVTTPANLAAELEDYGLSVSTIKIDPVQPAP